MTQNYSTSLFGRASDPVNSGGELVSAIGLDANLFASTVQNLNQGFINLQRRLAAGQHYQCLRISTQLLYLLGYLIGGHFVVPAEIRIAEVTMQVTPAQPDEYCRLSRVITFTLQA